MKQITAKEFRDAVRLDPAWASKLTEPVEVIDHCNMHGSKITHLSPQLHFTGQNDTGQAASFAQCLNLKTAEGTFHGYADFDNSGIEKIGEITITRPSNSGYAAGFQRCGNLKIAEGTFPGKVYFSQSSIERIGELTITKPNSRGDAASFAHCGKLRTAKGNFAGHVDFQHSGIEEILDLVITGTNADDARMDISNTPIKTVPKEFLGPECLMDEAVRRKNLQRITAGKAIKDAPDLEI